MSALSGCIAAAPAAATNATAAARARVPDSVARATPLARVFAAAACLRHAGCCFLGNLAIPTTSLQVFNASLRP